MYRPEEFGEINRYSGQKTIYLLLYKLLQNFSIFFPYITEEIYQELYKDQKSIHLTKIEALDYNYEKEEKMGDILINIISEIRGEKTTKNVTLKTPVKLLDIELSKDLNEALNSMIKDFKATLFIDEIKTKEIKESYKINNIELDIENKK